MTKDSLYQGDIFKHYLHNPDYICSEIGGEVLNEHLLLGWLAGFKELKTLKNFKIFKNEFKRQWHLNQQYLDLLSESAPLFERAEIQPILLKGITFIEKYYPDIGCRSMSDIDLLIQSPQLESTIKIFESLGFNPTGDKKWKANSHKVELTGTKEGIELVIEIHTSLFYHHTEPNWRTRGFNKTPFLQLETEELILYLCTHLGFQHTFLKLFWLMDIHYILSECEDLDENLVIELAKKHKVYNSLCFSLHILRKFFDTPMGDNFKSEIEKLSPFKKSLLSEKFILNPKGNYLNYQIVKHLTKDSLLESLKYDLGWFRNRLGQ